MAKPRVATQAEGQQQQQQQPCRQQRWRSSGGGGGNSRVEGVQQGVRAINKGDGDVVLLKWNTVQESWLQVLLHSRWAGHDVVSTLQRCSSVPCQQLARGHARPPGRRARPRP